MDYVKNYEKIALVGLLVTLIACSPTNKTTFGQADLLISISAMSVNYLDFPLKIGSIELIDDKGVEQRLSSSTEFNLANLSNDVYIVGKHSGIPAAHYKKLRINLQFNDESDIIFYSTKSETIYTKKMLSPKGKILGTELTDFSIEVPFLSKDNVIEIKDKMTHINIHFNLENMVVQREGDGDAILELRPIVSINKVEDAGPFKIRGKLLEVRGDGHFVIDSGFIDQLVVKAADNVRIKRDNTESEQKLSLADENSLTVSDVYIDKNSSIISNLTSLFSNQFKLFKGIVTGIESTKVQLLGNEYSKAFYFRKKNFSLEIPTEYFPIEKDRLVRFMPVSIDISNLSNEMIKRDVVLKGRSPENSLEKNTGNDSESILNGPIEWVDINEEGEIIYFNYSKENDSKQKTLIGDINDPSFFYVQILTRNSIYTGEEDYTLIRLSDDVSGLNDGLYVSEASLVLEQEGGVQTSYYSVYSLNLFDTDQTSYYEYDTINFNVLLKADTSIKPLAMNDLNLDEIVGNDEQVIAPEIRLGENNVIFEFVDKGIGLWSSVSRTWNTTCQSLIVNMNEQSQQIQPVTLYYMQGGKDTEKSESIYLESVQALRDWVTATNLPLYLDAINIKGSLMKSSTNLQCEFNVESLYLSIVDTRDSRSILADKSNEIDAVKTNNSGPNAAVIGSIAGLAGIGIIAGGIWASLQDQKGPETGRIANNNSFDFYDDDVSLEKLMNLVDDGASAEQARMRNILSDTDTLSNISNRKISSGSQIGARRKIR